MKKHLRCVSLALVLVMLLSFSALAAGETKPSVSTKSPNASATFNSSGDKINVTFSSSSMVVGDQYLILMVEGDETNHPINEDTILYIDQKSAVSGGANGPKVEFEVIPSSIENSVILIAGVTENGNRGPIVAAIVTGSGGSVVVGDMNGDNELDTRDASILLMYLAGMEVSKDYDIYAADFNGDGLIDTRDGSMMLRILAGLE